MCRWCKNRENKRAKPVAQEQTSYMCIHVRD